MLEKAPEPEFGGNARYSHTGFRFVHAGAARSAQFIRGRRASSAPYADPALYARELSRRPQPRDARPHRSGAGDIPGRQFERRRALDEGNRHQLGAREESKVDGKKLFRAGRHRSTPSAAASASSLQWREHRGQATASRSATSRKRARGPRQRAPRRGRARVDAGRRIRSRGPRRHLLQRRLPGQRRDARALSRAQRRPDEGARQQAQHRRGAQHAAGARRQDGRPLAGRAHVADRRATRRTSRLRAAGRPRQLAEPLRLSVRHHRQRARPALLRRRRGQALLHLCQDRPRRAAAAGRRRLPDLTTRPASTCSATAALCGDHGRGADDRGARQKIGIEPEVFLQRSRSSTPPAATDVAVRSAASSTARARSASRRRNRTGRCRSRSRRSAPIRSTGGVTFTLRRRPDQYPGAR